MTTIKELSMNPCNKCGKELRYPAELHTVMKSSDEPSGGFKCCKCMGLSGHEYGECFNPYLTRTLEEYKIHLGFYKAPERIPPEKECTEGCLTYSTYCEYNHS